MCIDQIEDRIIPLSPMPGKTSRADIKRLILRRFPFDIVVLQHDQKTIVIAVAHQSKKPGYWRDRIAS